MRGLFVLLLLANMAFIGWQFWAEPEQKGAQPYGGMTSLNDGLSLLSELSEEKHPTKRKVVSADDSEPEVAQVQVELIEPEPSVEPEVHSKSAMPESEEPAVAAVSVCYQSEPLAKLDEAKSLQEALSKIGITESDKQTVETTKVNYWVMLKPYGSRDKAKEAAEMLKQGKVKDFFIVRGGEYENAVSLGVFSTRERAELRYKAITSLKLRLRKPVIEAIELPAKRYVVSFSVTEEAAPSGLAAMLDDSDWPELKKIPCK